MMGELGMGLGQDGRDGIRDQQSVGGMLYQHRTFQRT